MPKTLGILMLDTHFPRIPGDVGNPASFPFPIVKKVITGASTERIVHGHDRTLLEPFCQAARELEQQGVAAITTSCGFLAMFQRELAEAVSVPMFTSSLLQVRLVSGMLPKGQIVGVLTADAQTLSTPQLEGVGIADIPMVIYGMEGTAFSTVFVGDTLEFDRQTAEREMVSVAQKMVCEHPEVGAIVMECTNMPPYARAVQQATGRPVYDITTLACIVMNGVNRTDFSEK